MAHPRTLPHRLVTTALALSLLGIGAGTAVAASPAVAAVTPAGLSLVAAVPSLTVDHYPGDPVYVPNTGVYVLAGAAPFEARLTHRPYSSPVKAVVTIGTGANRHSTTLPAGLVKSPNLLDGFFASTITDAAGTVVSAATSDFCPDSFSAFRATPSGPSTSPYPLYCGGNAFTIGAMLGLQRGWSVPALDPYSSAITFDGPSGTYHLAIRVTEAYRAALGIPVAQASASVVLQVRDVAKSAGRSAGSAPSGATGALTPAAAPSQAAPPPGSPTPDLRTLPAYNIGLAHQRVAGQRRTFLDFAATLWNGGASPLVVDGYRRIGTDVMDAYEYFYDASGHQVGSVKTGTFVWDPRIGHQHWHFTDFAQYNLLDSRQQLVVRSQKEGFCLAPTDPIDLLGTGADWGVSATGFFSVCGDEASLAIREALPAGWGDTYFQSLPGQSFDVTDLPNGTYYVQVLANPDGAIIESNTTNNASLRQVILSGSGAGRRVTVPPYQGIDAP